MTSFKRRIAEHWRFAVLLAYAALATLSLPIQRGSDAPAPEIQALATVLCSGEPRIVADASKHD